MDNEFDEYDEEDFPEADRGIYNPMWVLRAAISSSNSLTRWNALVGLATILGEAGQEGMLARDEVIDIIVQSMYTGEYVNPFAHACDCDEGEEDPITETEIDSFLQGLDGLDLKEYTDDEDND